MFLGGITDFLFPDIIGRIVNAMKEHDAANVSYWLVFWVIVLMIGAVSTMVNSICFAVVSERIGNRLRKELFLSLLKKDVGFYDDARTGDLRKSIIQISHLDSIETQC